MDLSPVRPLLTSRPKSGQVQSSRPSIKLLARSQQKWQMKIRQIGLQSQMATSHLLRRHFLLQTNLMSSSNLWKVFWRWHLELEIPQLSITHLLNKIWNFCDNSRATSYPMCLPPFLWVFVFLSPLVMVAAPAFFLPF